MIRRAFYQTLSVGHVGQKSDLTGALDGLGELTLMHGAGTGGTAGKNLAALRKEPAKLRGVLVINESGLVHAELANLSAATGLRIVLIKRHGSGTSFFKKSDEFKSERQLTVVFQLFIGAGRDLRSRSALRGGIVSAVISGLTAKAVSVAVLGVAAGIVVALAVAEIDIISLNVPRGTVVAFFVLPLAGLHPAGDNDHASLVEVLADKFAGLTPGGDIEKVGLAFAAGAPAEITVDSDTERRYVHTALGGTQLRLTGQTAHDDDVV